MQNLAYKLSIMMKYLLVVISMNVTVLAVMYFASDVRGNGVMKTKAIYPDRFNRVTLEGSGTARITRSESPFLEISTDENILDLLEIDVHEGNLRIRPTEDIKPSTLLLNIHSPDLQGITLTGNSTIEVPGLTGEHFSIRITDGGTADISGEVDNLAVEIGGNGFVRAANLVAQHAEIEISGKGDVQVHATDSLVANCAGLGDVHYFGQPILTNNCNGSVTQVK